ncbi:MAG TPA: hypothetical protein VNU46_09215 [Gemmatimonadaceae bacterium]|nr:hypothetical protein [Gemmatimonadaceae bacterium]
MAAPVVGQAAGNPGTPASVTAASRPFSFGLLGGPAFQIRPADRSNPWWHAGAFVTADPGWPISFRLEGVYARYNAKPQYALDDSLSLGEHATYTYATLDGIWRFPVRGPLRPYLIAGMGVYKIGYNSTCSVTPGASCAGYYAPSSSSSNFLGVNGGAGITMYLPGFSAFVEARWHNMTASAQSSPPALVPISVGITF